MSENEHLFWPITVVIALAAIALSIWAVSRNYDECRAVPHTAFYCLTAGG